MCQAAGVQGNSSRKRRMGKKFEDLQMAFKKEEIKHMKELYMARVSQVSLEVLA